MKKLLAAAVLGTLTCFVSQGFYPLFCIVFALVLCSRPGNGGGIFYP